MFKSRFQPKCAEAIGYAGTYLRESNLDGVVEFYFNFYIFYLFINQIKMIMDFYNIQKSSIQLIIQLIKCIVVNLSIEFIFDF